MDTLAARLREAFLGTETGEAVPFDELKDAVRDRWQRVADAAALRVPFSDAQIERMARAAHTRRMRDEERTKHWKDLPLFAKDAWRHGIRAALAAGGLEPCAVPEYDPSDVALSPTGHVLRDRLVEAEAKIERQRKNLNQLYEARERDAQLIADLRAEVDEDNAAAASVNDLLIKVQNLTAERDQQEIELADLRFYQREFAAVSAERDALRERASVPVKVRWDVSAPEAADWIRSSGGFPAVTWMSENKYMADGLIGAAMRYLAAHAVIDAPAGVPEGLPTADILAQIYNRVYYDSAPEGCRVNWEFIPEACREDMVRGTEAILTALRPGLRDPVAFELDVTADEALRVYARNHKSISGMQAVLDLCRSRIRPVYECKECAKCEAECRQWRNANDELVRRATAARAALEGE